MARFEAASGKAIDDGTQVTDENGKLISRKRALINELHLRGYGQRDAEAAEDWILKGNPVRYGSLTLADFFPTPEQMAQVRYDLTGMIAKAERAAERKGYEAGYSACQRQAEEQRQASPEKKALSEDERVELEYLRGKVEALEKERDVARANEIRRQKLQRRK